MFQTNYESNVGYMKNYSHFNNAAIRDDYLSFVAFNPVSDKSPSFQIFDSDETDPKQIIESYHTVIQNLRLIKRPAENRWSKQDKMWSELALGQDQIGNILIFFSVSPFSMFDFNESLLALPIHLSCAQHLEGGPPASFYLNHNGYEIKRVGSFETHFFETDTNDTFWALLNVIGIQKK